MFYNTSAIKLGIIFLLTSAIYKKICYAKVYTLSTSVNTHKKTLWKFFRFSDMLSLGIQGDSIKLKEKKEKSLAVLPK